MRKIYPLFTSTLILLCLFIAPVSAQSIAYVITADGDTLRGRVQQERSQQVVFRLTEQGERKAYAADELLGYGNQRGDHFVSRKPSPEGQQAAFFKVVVNGPVALYYNKGLRSEADYYIQKQNEPLIQLHRQFYAGTLASLLSDCSSLSPQKAKYTNSDLRELVSAYNQCRYGSQPSMAYSNEKDKIQVTAGIKAGIGYTSASVKGGTTLEGYTFDSHTGFAAGIFVNFRKPGKQLSLQPELWFSQRNTSAEEYFKRPNNGSYTGTITLDASLAQLPLLIKYDFKQSALQPYLLAGPSLNFVLANDTRYVVEYEATQNPIDREVADVNAGIGFVGGAGVAMPAGQRQLSLELRYSQEHFSSNSPDQSYRYGTLQLSGGITF